MLKIAEFGDNTQTAGEACKYRTYLVTQYIHYELALNKWEITDYNVICN